MRPETELGITSAEEDWTAANVLQQAALYGPAVFHAHLYVEKLLKALVIEAFGADKLKYTHNLSHLLSLSEVEAPRWVRLLLVKLSPHGVDGRYANTEVEPAVKYSKSTCAEVMLEAQEVVTWLRQQLI